MKKFKFLFIFSLFVLGLGFGFTTTDIAFADDDDDEYYEDYENERDGYNGEGEGEDGPFEEYGEMAGWGTVAAMGAAGILFPLRRSSKMVLKTVPDAKNIFISINKFFGKNHVIIGVTALVLSIAHGVLMFLSEGELESEGYTGIGSVLLMLIAAILGIVLIKNKKAKSVRTTHTVLIVFSVLIGIIHITIS